MGPPYSLRWWLWLESHHQHVFFVFWAPAVGYRRAYCYCGIHSTTNRRLVGPSAKKRGALEMA